MSRLPAADVAVYLPSAGGVYSSGWSKGGAETQSLTLARVLVDSGFRVRHIVQARPGQGPIEPLGGVEVVTFERPPGSALIRYRAIVRALADADARLYIQACAGYETGVVGVWARSHRRAFVFASMSDADFVTDRATARLTGAGLHLRRVVAQYRIGISLANAVVVETDAQRELARRRFGIDDAVVLPPFGAIAPRSDDQRDAFLWIGRLFDVKDPLAYLELARRVPEARFLMRATDEPSAPALAEQLHREADSIPNLELLPPQPRSDLDRLLRRTVALVNTSQLEGFPITFLEAWAHGTPVLSLRVDPDRVIERNDLGFVAGGSIERLASEARARWATRPDAFCEAAQVYVQKVHDPAVVGTRWAAVVRDLID